MIVTKIEDLHVFQSIPNILGTVAIAWEAINSFIVLVALCNKQKFELHTLLPFSVPSLTPRKCSFFQEF